MKHANTNLTQQQARLGHTKAIEPEYVGVDGAERMTGISRWTWRRMVYDNRIGSTKVGKRLLIPVSEIRRVLAEGYRPAQVEKAG